MSTRPFWATRLYKTAPLRAIVSVERSDGRDHLVTLECGHRPLATLRREIPIADADGVPRPTPVWLFKEDRCRTLLPRQRCRECCERAYPELRRLNHAGRYDDRDCTAEELARIAAHENGEVVLPAV